MSTFISPPDERLNKKVSVFSLIDNRDNSTDSRFPQIFDRSRQTGVGFVKYENIVGRADRIMFSSAGRSMFYFWTWRSDRFFEAIK